MAELYLESELDLTPLEEVERIVFESIPKYDPSLKHAYTVPPDWRDRNKPLCQDPKGQHESSLNGDVTCLVCRNTWHIQASGLRDFIYRTLKRDLRRSPLRLWVNYYSADRKCCVACDYWLDSWYKTHGPK